MKEIEFLVYVRGGGRITIPTEVRDVLDIEKGNLVKCKIQKVNRG